MTLVVRACRSLSSPRFAGERVLDYPRRHFPPSNFRFYERERSHGPRRAAAALFSDIGGGLGALLLTRLGKNDSGEARDSVGGARGARRLRVWKAVGSACTPAVGPVTTRRSEGVRRFSNPRALHLRSQLVFVGRERVWCVSCRSPPVPMNPPLTCALPYSFVTGGCTLQGLARSCIPADLGTWLLS